MELGKIRVMTDLPETEDQRPLSSSYPDESYALKPPMIYTRAFVDERLLKLSLGRKDTGL